MLSLPATLTLTCSNLCSISEYHQLRVAVYGPIVVVGEFVTNYIIAFVVDRHTNYKK